MRKLLLSFSACLALALPSAYGNSFFAGIEGRWNVVTEIRVGKSKLTRSTVEQVRKLQDGTYHVVRREKGKSRKDSETWAYPDGRLAWKYYEDGRYIGGGQGKWNLRGGKIYSTARGKTIYGPASESTREWKVNRNTYKGTGTVTRRDVKFRYSYTSTRIGR